MMLHITPTKNIPVASIILIISSPVFLFMKPILTYLVGISSLKQAPLNSASCSLVFLVHAPWQTTLIVVSSLLNTHIHSDD